MSDLDLSGVRLAASLAGEARLQTARLVLAADRGDDVGHDPEAIEIWRADLAGPFCGCDVCVVREVLDASLFHISRLIAMQVHAN